MSVLEVAETRPETRILARAARQHGLVTTAQLLAVGWSRDVITRHMRSAWLRRLHRGVYLAGPLETPHTAAMAAVLATGGAVFCYSAAVLWDWRPPRDGPIDVVLRSGAHNRPGISVHRASLHPRDITRRHAIPVTSAARTLLDIAATEPRAELERALNEAKLQRHVSTHSLTEQFSRYPHHRGTTALKNATQTDPGFTRSEAERRMLDLIRRAGLPRPEVNVRIAGHEVDLLWRAANLVVEVDGYTSHSPRRSFEQDRRRDQALVANGLRVARVTWRQLGDDELGVATRLATALAA
jgi:very-short-patch-repair endonuclease